MAVALKNNPETAPHGLLARLPIASLLGVLYVVGSLVVVFWVIPQLWGTALTPALGTALGTFFNAALLVLAMFAAAVALAYLGLRLLGPHPQPGLKAGIFVGLLLLLLVGLLTRWASVWLEHWTYYNHLFGDAGRTAGILLTLLVAAVLVLVILRLALRPSAEQFLIALEEQGWFSTTSYKQAQGQRVRRGTILGILILAGAGIFTLLHGKRLEAGPSDWSINLPFTGKVHVENENDARVVLKDRGLTGDPMTLDRYAFRDINEELLANYRRVVDPGASEFEEGQIVNRTKFNEVVASQDERINSLLAEAKELDAQGQQLNARNKRQEAERIRRQQPTAEEPVPAAGKTTYSALTLLPAVRFSLPLLLAAAAIWLAWRIVNLPVFADFLIATEAEMNKVSWSSKRRLVQDTIVVLVTVFLLSLFLLFADILWSNLLRGIGVLRLGDGSGDATSTQKHNQTRPW